MPKLLVQSRRGNKDLAKKAEMTRWDGLIDSVSPMADPKAQNI